MRGRPRCGRQFPPGVCSVLSVKRCSLGGRGPAGGGIQGAGGQGRAPHRRFHPLCSPLCPALHSFGRFTPVPITGQTFAMLITGAALGSWRGATRWVSTWSSACSCRSTLVPPMATSGRRTVASTCSVSAPAVLGFIWQMGLRWIHHRPWPPPGWSVSSPSVVTAATPGPCRCCFRERAGLRAGPDPALAFRARGEDAGVGPVPVPPET